MVRNEADIVGHTIRHLLNEGIDYILVADNLSTDATSSVLQNFVGNARVLVVEDSDPAYRQSEKMTALAHRARRLWNVDWILPCDADEIFYATEGRLKDFFEGCQSDVVIAQGWDHILTRAGPHQPFVNPYLIAPMRRDRPQRLGKIAFRWHPAAVIEMGNHSVTNHPGQVTQGLFYRHLQYRSLEQMSEKVRGGTAALEKANLEPMYGAHWRELADLSDNALLAKWQSLQHENGLVRDSIPYRANNDKVSAPEPLISVCIPTFNGADFLAETLESVAQQTYRPIELIVSDDESTDTTIQLAEDFAASVDFPVEILKHAHKGIGSNWNYAIKAAQGSYIKLLMQDDIIAPDFLRKMVGVLQQNPSLGLAFSKRDVLASGAVADIEAWKAQYGDLQQYTDAILPDGQLDRAKFFAETNLLKEPINVIGEPSVTLFTRAALEKVGLFSEKLSQALDVEYWFRLLGQYDAVHVPERLATFRRHPKQATEKNLREGRIKQEEQSFYANLVRHVFFNLSLPNKLRLLMRFLTSA